MLFAVVTRLRELQPCPCGSGEAYADCCGALHRGLASGTATAPTAERLMRSRFSAYAVGDVEYLLATWHRATRPASLQLDPDLEWRQLEILGATDGGEDDRVGTVEFVATYWDAGQRQFGQQREHSSFVKQSEQWLYVNAAS